MRPSRLVPRAAALAAAVLLAGCIGPGGPLNARDQTVETRSLDADGRFSLENVNGTVTLTTWSKEEVRIEADRAAVDERALERLRVEISGEGREVEVRTRHRSTGFPFMNAGGKVDYRVTVPAGAQVKVSTVNGRIEVAGVAGDLRVESVNGPVQIRDAAGAVEAATVNGGIDARYAATPDRGRHRFETVNGGIEVELPDSAEGYLDARTVNGSISCDLPIAEVQKSRRRLEGRLGSGDGSFDLETVNGSVRVRRGGGRLPAEAS